MATIRDVAREAGVSIATISRLFNGSARVSDDTSRRVREVAERMGYWPNGAARSLITKRTHALGVLLPDLYGDFFSEVIRGIDLTARREGFHLVVSSSHADAGELLAALQTMRGRIDGLIAMAPDLESPVAFEQSARQFPIVLINPGFDSDACASVATDNLSGAREVVRHLAKLGHREIAFIAGPETNRDAAQRLQGYRSALRGLGLRVPEDVAVAGFDDIAIASYISPRLTTVRVEASRLGERAAQLLMEAVRRRSESPIAAHEVLPTSLVVRESSDASVLEGSRPAGAR